MGAMPDMSSEGSLKGVEFIRSEIEFPWVPEASGGVSGERSRSDSGGGEGSEGHGTPKMKKRAHRRGASGRMPKSGGGIPPTPKAKRPNFQQILIFLNEYIFLWQKSAYKGVGPAHSSRDPSLGGAVMLEAEGLEDGLPECLRPVGGPPGRWGKKNGRNGENRGDRPKQWKMGKPSRPFFLNSFATNFSHGSRFHLFLQGWRWRDTPRERAAQGGSGSLLPQRA